MLCNYIIGVECWNTVFQQQRTRKEAGQFYADIQDGKVYQDLVKSGFLKSRFNFSLILNVDGVPVFRSSSYSFWPVHLFVNELPYRQRYGNNSLL